MTFSDIPTLLFFPGVSHFFVHSPGLLVFVKISWFLEQFENINVQIIETHVGFSDTCGNG